MIVDGKPGSFTRAAYEKASPQLQQAVDSVVSALGVQGGLPTLLAEYQTTKITPASYPEAQKVFDLQVVPAVIREARSSGLFVPGLVAQLALESNHGKSTPRGDDGKPSFNYAGIKWNTVKTSRVATAATREFENGAMVNKTERFAAFDTPTDFAKAYVGYLLGSKRYKDLPKATSAKEWFTVLKKGGYATDPEYVAKGVSVADRVTAKYALA